LYGQYKHRFTTVYCAAMMSFFVEVFVARLRRYTVIKNYNCILVVAEYFIYILCQTDFITKILML